MYRIEIYMTKISGGKYFYPLDYYIITYKYLNIYPQIYNHHLPLNLPFK